LSIFDFVNNWACKTRQTVTTQPLHFEHGDDQATLTSIYNIFPLTRGIIKSHGRDSVEFNKIAIIVLNQIIRPFTAKWHRLSVENSFGDENSCLQFRSELSELQEKIRVYTRMLSEMAGVEDDLTELEDV